jgi:phospholipid/cholesterol/gamma-HCH transport system substrate-binding protein/paraquat-inducible protein B
VSDDGRYVRVGAFVFGGIAMIVIAVLVFGGGRFFERPIVAETVFDESVQGVDVGSPVKLRGVKIGTVSYIGLVGDSYSLENSPNPVEEGNRVLVRMDIHPGGEMERSYAEQLAIVKELAAKGLRLRITPLGVTGTSFIQADYVDPEKNPPMDISFQPEHVYIPSAPSTISQLTSGAERLVSRIDKLDVESLLTNFDKLLVSLNATIGEADVQGARKSVGELLDELSAATADLRKAVKQADVGGLNRDLRKSLDQLAGTLQKLERVVDASGDDLATLLDNMRVASENLREASETVRAYPSYLIFGSPPEPLAPPVEEDASR